MKKAFKFVGIALLAIVVLLLAFGSFKYFSISSKVKDRYATLGEGAPELNDQGYAFRDLNKNGKLDPYEDKRVDIDKRIDDLLSQMTLEEKAGTMFITMIGMTDEGEPIETPFIPSSPIDIMFIAMLPPSSEMMIEKKMNSFNIVHSYDAEVMAKYNNALQKIGERSRLGIPFSIASDPRHGTANNPGAALFTPAFAQWPSSLGFAATRDTVLMQDFANMARQEYLSVGIRVALHPMADLFTEPRWGRGAGTFGEDAMLSAMMTKAYVKGFQGDTLTTSSVACMTKHFSGGGPQEDGEDPHFPYGKNQVYPGNMFDYHVIPFEKGAFPANTAQIMPYYGIPVDQTDENVAFAFNKTIITTMLRERYGFDGVICTDWNIINGSGVGDARAWGVEDLSPLERTLKVLEAGCDQFGGESSPELIVELVNSGKLSEERVNVSVRRILRDKFTLGLFDNPYVNPDEAKTIAGNDSYRKAGKRAQAQSSVLLKNEDLLPLKKGIKLYVEGLENVDTFADYATLVGSAEEADVVVKRIMTPFDPRDDYFLEQFFHQGRLFYNEEELEEILETVQKKPTVVVANLERPAILTEIDQEAKAMIADFGLSDEVMAHVLFGTMKPGGKLPFELPSSWQAVLDQKEDVPYDSKAPLYPFGHGLSYDN